MTSRKEGKPSLYKSPSQTSTKLSQSHKITDKQ